MKNAIALAALVLAAPTFAGPKTVQYTDTCDASAGVAISADQFLMASDEDNVLRVYRRDTGGRPLSTHRLDAFLGIAEEADIEAVARVGDRLYWLTSHGRNKKGKPRPARQQFFCTDLKAAPIGSTYRDLLKQMLASPKLAPLGLATAEPNAPEAGGVNIEALGPRAEGGLWIGFRSPVPSKGAILLPFLNPEAVVTGAAPSFGDPVHLDLGGRGIRSLEQVGASTLVIAGPTADSGTFQLFNWSGRAADQPRALSVPLGDLRPEALFAWPDGKLTLLSDDGGIEVNGVECKDLPDATARGFRALEIQLPAR